MFLAKIAGVQNFKQNKNVVNYRVIGRVSRTMHLIYPQLILYADKLVLT